MKKSELKDNHIVVNRNGTTFRWKDLKINKNEDLTDVLNSNWDIMEIYEFETLVWKREEVEILDKEEQEYLSTVIKPVRDNVVYILKNNYIDIYLEDDDSICLYDHKDSEYKNMELDKKYTLEELGL